MANNDDNNPISEEYKNVQKNVHAKSELARLYKEVDNLNKSRESLIHPINHKVKALLLIPNTYLLDF